MISQLQAEFEQAHVELLCAMANRNLCANDFNKSEVLLSEACRKRYLANRAYDIELLKQGLEYEI